MTYLEHVESPLCLWLPGLPGLAVLDDDAIDHVGVLQELPRRLHAHPGVAAGLLLLLLLALPLLLLLLQLLLDLLPPLSPVGDGGAAEASHGGDGRGGAAVAAA